MIINTEEGEMMITDSIESEEKSLMQNLMIQVLKSVDSLVAKYYSNPESLKYNVKAPEMIVMLSANIFANYLHRMMGCLEATEKMKIFDILNNELIKLTKNLFTSLEAHLNADENTVN